jgi:hypothetical protein
MPFANSAAITMGALALNLDGSMNDGGLPAIVIVFPDIDFLNSIKNASGSGGAETDI